MVVTQDTLLTMLPLQKWLVYCILKPSFWAGYLVPITGRLLQCAIDEFWLKTTEIYTHVAIRDFNKVKNFLVWQQKTDDEHGAILQ